MKISQLARVLMIGLFVSALAFSCTEDDDEASSLPNGWTQIQKTAFITGCTTPDEDNEAGTEAQCECYFEKVSAEYSYDDIQNASIEEAISIALLGLTCF